MINTLIDFFTNIFSRKKEKPKEVISNKTSLITRTPSSKERHYTKLKAIKKQIEKDIENKSGIIVDRIILCWTSTGYEFEGLSKARYHFAVDNKANIHRGKYTVDDNTEIVEREKEPSEYAKFVRGLNENSISVAMTGMVNITPKIESPGLVKTDYPITRIQFDTFCILVNHLRNIYGIPLNYRTILSRAEIEETLKIKQSKRLDISLLPFYDTTNFAIYDPVYVGNKIRNKIHFAKSL